MDNGLRILVVDDDEVLRKLIVSILSKVANVHALESGNEAIAYLKDHDFDLIFSDASMPNGTGIDLLAWVQEHRKHIPLILVTGQSPISKSEALQKGAARVIAKPFRMKALLDAAQELRPAA